MADRVFLPPNYIKAPDLHPLDTYMERYEEYRRAIQAFCEEQGKGSFRGREIRFPVADGYACYFIFSLRPVVLIKDDSGDGWDYAHIDDLKVSTLKEEAERLEKLNKLFAGNKKEEDDA